MCLSASTIDCDGQSVYHATVMSALSRASWSELELARLMPEKGALGDVPWPLYPAFVPPSLSLESDRLLWSYRHATDATVGGREVDPRGMLPAFLRIRDAEGVLHFAERYGVLELCEHSIPAPHTPPPGSFAFGELGQCLPLGAESQQHWEPIERWLHFVRGARALLQIAAALHQGHPGKGDDWAIVYEDFSDREGFDTIRQRPRSVEDDRDHFQLWVGEWLRWGRPAFSFSWLEREPQVTVWAHTFGHLALQLVSSATRLHGLAWCIECGQAYLANRKPQAGRRNYCQECGETAASRNRQREYQSRKRRRGSEQAS